MSHRRGATLRRVLANRRLRRVEFAFLGFGAAEYGVWLAVLVYAYERGGTTLAGVIAVAQLLPAAAVAPLAARSVDRTGGGRVLRIGYLIQAVALSATAVALLLDLWPPWIYAGAIITASAVTLIRPAQNAMLPGLVSEPADLTAANAVTGWVESVSVLIGPALAGVMIAIDGPGAALAVFAAAVAISALLVAELREPDRSRDAVGEDQERASDDLGVLDALRGDVGLLVVLALVAVQFVALGALDVLEVVLALKVLHLGPSGAGYLSAAYGAGGVIGAIGTLALDGRRHLSGTMLFAAAASGAAFLALGAWPTVVGAFALLGGIGAGRAVLDMAGRTILHRVVPVEVRGRVFGLLEGVAMLGLALGSISVPGLVAAGGATAALVSVGGMLLVAALVSAPTLRGLERAAPAPSVELGVLRRSPLFGMLAAPVLEDLARALVSRPVVAGEVVVREGEPGDRFYLVAAGEFEVSIGGRHVRTVAPGDGFGEIALLRDGIRTATVAARGPGILYALERAPFLEAVTGSSHAHRVAENLVAGRLGTTLGT